ncbi:protein kinase domain-containing protein [Legionella shakespearei]|uniref:Ser/Thr protein kinase n=1 Tax=Legionella shakespearei DSM 23087 TaxID=1122169 RepID=A0A0W0YQT0_9GAMM|nr:protein kinase [Legionella shakespearei]KTD59234.1 Ser/Thr protein kinase [Legionella shakespearei DSM 23087]
MIDINDFDNLNDDAKIALAKLLKKDDDTRLWAVGEHDELKLGFRIIKHFSSDKPRDGIPGPRVRYEVIDNEVFNDEGTYGKYYRCRYTLSFDNDGKLLVKKRQEGRIRLVKEQNIREKTAEHLKLMVSEAEAMQRSDTWHRLHDKPEIFHAKPMVQVDNKTYMIMRELPGVQLLKMIEDNELTLQERLDLSIALLTALKEQVHDLGYVHRDIKPDNILVYKNGSQFEIYIIDFGFIKRKEYSDANAKMGSPPYAAPECYSTFNDKTEKTDIYAMGRTLMFLWGYRQLDHGRDKYDEACAPAFNNLFYKLDPKPGCHRELKIIFENMCQLIMSQRPDLADLLEQFEGLRATLEPNSVFTPTAHDGIFKFDEEEDDYGGYLGFGNGIE